MCIVACVYLGVICCVKRKKALRLIVSEAATTELGKENLRKVVMINDVARAYFEAKASREVCVEPPEEWMTGKESTEEWVAYLEKSLHETRDAALNFQRECNKFLESIGSKTGRYNTGTDYHPKRQLRMMLHGDDFATVGEVEEI